MLHAAHHKPYIMGTGAPCLGCVWPEAPLTGLTCCTGLPKSSCSKYTGLPLQSKMQAQVSRVTASNLQCKFHPSGYPDTMSPPTLRCCSAVLCGQSPCLPSWERPTAANWAAPRIGSNPAARTTLSLLLVAAPKPAEGPAAACGSNQPPYTTPHARPQVQTLQVDDIQLLGQPLCKVITLAAGIMLHQGKQVLS